MMHFLVIRFFILISMPLGFVVMSCSRSIDDRQGRNTDPCSGVTVTVTGSVQNASAGQSNGTVAATATGGSGFLFSIDGTNFQSSGLFNNLAAGNYTVTARNSSGCTGSAAFTVGVANPCMGVAISVNATGSGTTQGQHNGSISAVATGGTAPYVFSINNGSTFQPSGNFGNLASGPYTVLVRDANGCTGSAAVTIANGGICGGVTLNMDITTLNTAWNYPDGRITINQVTGGTAPFQYSLNNGPAQSANVFSELVSGVYTIRATDANGCSGQRNVFLQSINPCGPGQGLTLMPGTTTSPFSSDGTLHVSSASGIDRFSLNGGPFAITSSYSGLPPGIHRVDGRNDIGCLYSASREVTSASPCPGGPISISVTSTASVPCAQPTGNVSVSVSGGTAPYQYSLNNGPWQTSSVFTGVDVDVHGLVVRDATGCLSAAPVVMNRVPSGPLFRAAQEVIVTRCASASCHGPAASGGFNFRENCQIVQGAGRIRIRSVHHAGSATQMPPQPRPALTADEQTRILNWINAGARIDQ